MKRLPNIYEGAVMCKGSRSKRMIANNLRCPRCKSHELVVHEVWIRRLSWPLSELVAGRGDGQGDSGGEISHVEAECDACGHFWRLRNAKQVTDLTGEFS